ncbi:helix-turn-helix domain-containing protein [Rahnella inusitata]|uniref:helix-turn-helix domain-containing protein n=1 Tax=Rahnella inusitata TaxID=58169 RepID=UPI0039AFFC7E
MKSVNEPVKNEAAIIKLINIFKRNAKDVDIEAEGKDFDFVENGELLVLLLCEGKIDIYKTSDNLLYACAMAPFILGIEGSFYRYDFYRFRLHHHCIVKTLTLNQCIELISAHDLIKTVLNYQAYLNDYTASRIELLVNRTSYEMVRGLLYELERLPHETRIKTSIINYIKYRSNLSKSGIVSIISTLRKGGYIEVCRGKLISISRKLPKKY